MTTPSYIPTLLVLTALATIVACNPFANHARVGQIDPDDSGASTRWNATLSTPSAMTGAVDLHGTASLASHGEGKSVATVSISNAAPSGSHPWHVYQGKCGDSAVVVGSATAYPMLNVNQQGTATSAATLPLELPTTGTYYVAVNASAKNMETIVACGNLAPPDAQ